MGSTLLIVAVVAGAGASGYALTGRQRLARIASSMLVLALVAATLRLIVAVGRLDFSFVYVANQSRARSSGAYRLAALWGGAEGSLLFFTALAALVFLWIAWRGAATGMGLATSALVLSWLAFVVVAFANPFTRADLPVVRGAGLTPILEHPAMLYHPPILYLGLVTTLIAFVVVLDRRPLSAADLLVVRRSMVVSWTLLTVGLATGANWAYVELGWGGYWAWDPVENTVLMPWLVLTAGLHVLRDKRIQSRFPRSFIALLLLPFPLVAFGAAVTRSGGLSSVHAFADAEALGWTLGALVACMVAVTAWRIMATEARDSGRFTATPRQWLLAGSCAGAIFMTVVVMLGVALPLMPASHRVVTAQYYNRIGVPVLVLVLVGLSAVPMVSRGALASRLGLSVAGAVTVGLGAFSLGVRDGFLLVVVAVCGVVVIGHLLGARRTPMATVVGHIGFAVLAIGIAGSAQAETVASALAPGESVALGDDLTFTYESFLVSDGPRLRSEAVTAQVVVASAGSDDLLRLTPGLVSYPDRAVVLAETSLHSTPIRDIQVVLRTVSDEGLASFELSERPVLMLVWWGTALITLAGLIALPKRGLGSDPEAR